MSFSSHRDATDTQATDTQATDTQATDTRTDDTQKLTTLTTHKHPKRLLFTLYLIVFLNSFGYFLIFPVLSDMIFGHSSVVPQGWAKSLGEFLFPVVLGAGTLGGLFFAPLIGRLSDRIGRRNILLTCTCLTAISFLLPIGSLTFGSIILFILGNWMNGIASNNQAIALASISDVSPARYAKTYRFSVDTAVICLAMSTGPLVGGLLSDASLSPWLSQKTPFYFALLLTALSLVLVYRWLPETFSTPTPSLSTNTASLPTRTTSISTQNRSALFKGALRDLKDLNRPTQSLLFITWMIQMSWAQFFQYLYLYYPTQFHWSDARISIYTSLLGAYLIFGLLVIVPYLLKRLSLPNIIIGSIACVTLSFIGLASMGVAAQWLFGIPLSLAIGIYYPCVLNLLSEQSAKTQQAWILSITGAIMGGSWLITSFTSLWLAHYFPTLPLYCSALLGILGWISALKLKQLLTT